MKLFVICTIHRETAEVIHHDPPLLVEAPEKKPPQSVEEQKFLAAMQTL